MNLLETHVPEVESCSLIFNDYLVWSSVSQNTMGLLSDYLISPELIDARKGAVEGAFASHASDHTRCNHSHYISSRISLPLNTPLATYPLLSPGVVTLRVPSLITSYRIFSSLNKYTHARVLSPDIYITGEQVNWSPSHRLLLYQSGLCTLVLIIGASSLKKAILRTSASTSTSTSTSTSIPDYSAAAAAVDKDSDGIQFALSKISTAVDVCCSGDLSRLNTVLHTQYSRIIFSGGDVDIPGKFMYFNAMNNAIKLIGLCPSLDKTITRCYHSYCPFCSLVTASLYLSSLIISFLLL